MNIIERILTNNPCYRSGRTIIPRGVMVHSPGVAQPNPEVFMRMWDNPAADVGVHAIVSMEGVHQLLPWTCRGGHCYFGPKGSGNDTHIGFEICEPAGHTYQGGTMIGYDVAKNAAYFSEVYRNAVELTAQLCKKYNLDPLAPGVVICHSEGYKLGIASNHADVMHWFPKHNKSMDTFRADVAKEMRGEIDMTREEVQAIVAAAVQAIVAAAVQAVKPKVYTTIPEVPEWARGLVQRAKDAGIIKGDGTGKLNLTDQDLKTLSMMDGAGLLKGAV